MSWSGNLTLSTATALTTPQEFFLGSQYTRGHPHLLQQNCHHQTGGGRSSIQISASVINRPVDPFIARRVWWRIPIVYQTTQQTLEDRPEFNRFPSAPANYVLSAYEIPSQLPISGNANLQIGNNADGTAWGGTPWSKSQVQSMEARFSWPAERITTRRHQFTAAGKRSQTHNSERSSLCDKQRLRRTWNARNNGLDPTRHPAAPLRSRWLEMMERY